MIQQLIKRVCLFSWFFFLLKSGFLVAQGPEVLQRKSTDIRLQPLKDLDGYFPFQPPGDIQTWNKRKEKLKQQTKIALGLFPEPTRTPLNPVIHGKIDLGDYTVEKVFFESMPGYYVTGSLYRPKEIRSQVPGVLCPHGHWANGRFYDAGEANAKALIKQGAESDVEAARNHIQARCIHLARMGCVVLQYDMIGYADSLQISYELAHRFAKQRPEFNGESNWGFFSPQAELNLQSIMGLQSWNSIRALDFLESLPEIDKSKFAVTGASGGGTQSFLLAAIDDRIKVSFPAVMVSTSMQGGCTCENCSLLRVTTGNVELAGLFAPKPQGVTAANDWTKEMRDKGYPELKELYSLFDAAENLTFVDRTEFGHNYNQVSRNAMYRWLKKHFNLKGSIKERPFRRLTAKELTVWNDQYPKPEFDPDFERKLLAWWTKDVNQQIKQMQVDRKTYREFFRQAYRGILQRDIPLARNVIYETTYKKEYDTYFVIGGPLKNSVHQEEIPTLFIHPKKWDGEVVIVVGERGKNELYSEDGQIMPQIQKLVDGGKSVVGVDLIFQGEMNQGKPLKQTRRVKNPREAAAYTFGYNHSVFAQRSHDLVNLLTLVANHERKPEKISLLARGNTGPICAAALALNPTPLVQRLVIAPQSDRVLRSAKIHSPFFLPGVSRYRGLEGMLVASGVETKEAVAAKQWDLVQE